MKWNKIECVTFRSRNISDAKYGFSFIDDSLLFIFRNFRNKNLYICLFPLLFFFCWLFIHFCTSLILFSSMICAQKYEFIRAHRRPKTYREQRKWEGCNNRQNQHLVVESTYRLIFIAVVGIQFHWASYWTPAFRQTQISIE